MINLAVLIVGFSGLCAQVLLLRELLVAFFGSELTIGLVLANWMALEAAGVYIIGKNIEKVKNKANLFVGLEVVFSLFFSVSIYSCRVFKVVLGMPAGEAPGLILLFVSSLLILLPLGFCHGALFAASCALYSKENKKSHLAIGRVYSRETIGTIIAGLALTYLFIPRLDTFGIASVIVIMNILFCFFFMKYISKRMRIALALTALFTIIFFFFGGFAYLQRASVEKSSGSGRVTAYYNSVYGNIRVTESLKQATFYYNGIPVITTPLPDIASVEEFGHFPVLFCAKPDNILILGSGAGGLLTEVLKHPVKKIDYAESDPQFTRLLKEYPAQEIHKEFSDSRLKVIYQDARLFVRSSRAKYDVILIGLSRPADLTTNRLFTQEFFASLRERMNSGAVLAFRLDGSLTYLSRQLKDLNACVLNGLRNVFAYVQVIPGDYNLFIASDDKYIGEFSAQLLSAKLSRDNINTRMLLPAYLDHRLDPRKQEWFYRQMQGATVEANRDLKPLAVYQMLLFWNKRFWPGSERLFCSLRHLTLSKVAGFMLLLTALLAYIFRRRPKHKFPMAYSIFTTGFFGMSASLLLIFAFQVFYGYLYYSLGIFISIFMAGIACGSLVVTGAIDKIKNEFKLFISFEIAIIAYCFLLAVAIARAGLPSVLLFSELFFVSGLFMGIEFPLAAKIYAKDTQATGKTAGALYAADLLGGWLAGLTCGAVLLPVLGFFNSCLVIAALKLSSLALYLNLKTFS